MTSELPERRPEYRMKSSTDSGEESLRAEIAELRRQLEEHKRLTHEASKMESTPPSRGRLWLLALSSAALIAAAFIGGYLPRHRREALLVAEAKFESQADPVVNVVAV